MKILLRSIFTILIVSLLLPISAVMAQPNPHLFSGTVTLDGSAVPDGTSVTATMGGAQVGSASTTSGEYTMAVSADGSLIGNGILFYVNGLSAGSSTFAFLGNTTLNLAATTAAPAAPPPPITTYTLTINTSGTAGTASGAGTYNAGQLVSITAAPGVDSTFNNWTGDVGTIANLSLASTTITMNGNYTITANFSSATPVLTMAVNGNGSTSPSVGTHTYPEGTVVLIAAIANSGQQFDNWTGSASSNSAATTITMNADKTVTANFSVDAAVSSLEAALAAAEAQVSALETELASAEAEVSSLKANLTAAEAQVSALETELASAEAEISSLKAEVSALKAQVSALEAEISALEEAPPPAKGTNWWLIIGGAVSGALIATLATTLIRRRTGGGMPGGPEGT